VDCCTNSGSRIMKQVIRQVKDRIRYAIFQGWAMVPTGISMREMMGKYHLTIKGVIMDTRV
jgi:hypothetical protein